MQPPEATVLPLKRQEALHCYRGKQSMHLHTLFLLARKSTGAKRELLAYQGTLFIRIKHGNSLLPRQLKLINVQSFGDSAEKY